MLAKELYPGNFKPTAAHYFLKLLESKGLLLRCFTQNIDSLEQEAGVSAEKIVAAHGNFDGVCWASGVGNNPVQVFNDTSFLLQVLIVLIAMQLWRRMTSKQLC